MLEPECHWAYKLQGYQMHAPVYLHVGGSVPAPETLPEVVKHYHCLVPPMPQLGKANTVCCSCCLASGGCSVHNPVQEACHLQGNRWRHCHVQCHRDTIYKGSCAQTWNGTWYRYLGALPHPCSHYSWQTDIHPVPNIIITRSDTARTQLGNVQPYQWMPCIACSKWFW